MSTMSRSSNQSGQRVLTTLPYIPTHVHSLGLPNRGKATQPRLVAYAISSLRWGGCSKVTWINRWNGASEGRLDGAGRAGVGRVGLVHVQSSLGPLHSAAGWARRGGREQRRAAALPLGERLYLGQVRAAENVDGSLQSDTGHCLDE